MNHNHDNQLQMHKPFDYSIMWRTPYDHSERELQKKLLADTTAQLSQQFDQVMRFCFVWLSDQEMIQQQISYRNRTESTDVLTFPAREKEQGIWVFSADILLSMTRIKHDAELDGIGLESHLAHILFHGMLHALGYDHIEHDQRQQMRALENQLMHALRYDPPWPIDEKS